MINPNLGDARRKLIRRLNLITFKQIVGWQVLTKEVTTAFNKEATITAAAIESGTLKVSDLKDKVAQRYANILDPNNWETCTGEAHSNLHIDSCGVCSPNWGKIWKESK